MDNNSNESKFLSEATVLTGRYVIQQVIGAGGFGITYKAWDRLMEQSVALKEYYPAGVVNRQIGSNTISLSTESYRDEFLKGKQRFLAEAKELVKLKDSPYVVNVQNFFEENQTAYMAMEFLDGVTLGQYYKSMGGTIDVESSLPIMGKIMTALEEIHKVGIIHRDISPDNIFVLPDGNVKLIDFGAAKQSYCGETQNLSIMLKPGYAPPEQYSNNAPQGPWTDIYAFGATMYRMLTGKKPAESVSRMLNDILIPPAAINPDIPAYLNNAIVKSMAIKPEDRFHNAFEFRNAVFNPAMQDNTPVAQTNNNNIVSDGPKFVKNNADNKTLNNGTGTVMINQPAGSFVQGGMSPANMQGRPAWNSVNNTQGNYNPVNNMQARPNANMQGKPPANKNKGKMIAIICIFLCLIGCGVFAAFKLGGKDKDVSDKTTTEYADKKDTEEKTEKPTTEIVVSTVSTEEITETPSPSGAEKLENGIELPDPHSTVKLTVYTGSDEFSKRIEYFYNKYPEYRGRIDHKIIDYIDESDFCDKVNAEYAAGYGVDVVLHDESGLSALADDNMYVNLSDIGFLDSYYTESYDFAKDRGSVNGSLRGVTYQTFPGVMLYRSDLAYKVFDTNQPNEMANNFYNWESYIKTAELVASKNCYINSSTDELRFGSMANYDLESVEKELIAGGYTKGRTVWSKEWIDDMDGDDVFAYFACSWFISNILSGNKEWVITYAPCYFTWGGSYLAATKDCLSDVEKCRLATLLFYTICCDEEVVRQMTDDTGECPNNKNVVNAIATLESYPNPKLLNNNPFYYYKEALDGLDKK